MNLAVKSVGLNNIEVMDAAKHFMLKIKQTKLEEQNKEKAKNDKKPAKTKEKKPTTQ